VTISKRRYVRELYDRLVCAHCGATKRSPRVKRMVLHHPDNDGHLGRVNDIKPRDPDWKERIDAEVARCVPLCGSCHSKEHERQRLAAGWRRVIPTPGTMAGWYWQPPEIKNPRRLGNKKSVRS
jgi:hypothetical protein